MFPNQPNSFFHFLNDIWTKDSPFSGFRPVQGGSTPSTIKSFKRCHLQALLVAIIISKLTQWQTLFPILGVGQSAGLKHVFWNLIYTLNLATSLRVISRAVNKSSSKC